MKQESFPRPLWLWGGVSYLGGLALCCWKPEPEGVGGATWQRSGGRGEGGQGGRALAGPPLSSTQGSSKESNHSAADPTMYLPVLPHSCLRAFTLASGTFFTLPLHSWLHSRSSQPTLPRGPRASTTCCLRRQHRLRPPAGLKSQDLGEGAVPPTCWLGHSPESRAGASRGCILHPHGLDRLRPVSLILFLHQPASRVRLMSVHWVIRSRGAVAK